MRSAAVLLLFCLSCSLAPAQCGDGGAIETLLDRFTQDWAHADAAGIACLFEPDADLVTPYGMKVSARASIEQFYARAFQLGYKGSSGGAHVDSTRRIGPDFAILNGAWSITGAHTADGKPRPAEHGLFTAVVVRQNGSGWRIAALREMIPAALP